MEKLTQKEHDFSAKLRQDSVIDNLKEYITWQRNVRRTGQTHTLPQRAPISINLDLTSACNFACPHCVDSKIINAGEQLDLENIEQSVETLTKNGLKSVILLGGGEPTLHRDFEEIVRFIKAKGLQVGIATNGSKLQKIAQVADLLQEGDWLRLSLDAGKEDTFLKSHRPRGNVNLQNILIDARQIKQINPKISLGYSFVIVWKGISLNGNDLCANIDEMALAVSLAKDYCFDYVSFKPCLLRLEGSQKESLLAQEEDIRREDEIIKDIKDGLLAAREAASGKVKILESVNLMAMLDKQVHELKRQPRVCHSQFFRTVLTPTGVFHCPAFRGVDKAKIGSSDAYADDELFNETGARLQESLKTFNAEQECNVIACFYHHVNWWMENFIESDKDINEIERVEDNNFFL